MDRFSFSIVLAVPTVTNEQCDALYEAGCDDGTVVTREGATYVVFEREGEPLEDVLRSAVAQVTAAGLEVAQIKIDLPL